VVPAILLVSLLGGGASALPGPILALIAGQGDIEAVDYA
jgi:hypothetical protein